MYNRKLAFFAACAGMLLFGIGLITLGSVAADLKTRFHLDALAAGTLFSILPIGILVGSLLFGRLCDRYGYKGLLIVSCMGMCAGFEGIAYATSLTILHISIFIFGLCGGAINGATNALVSDISIENKGANLSLLGVFFGIGALGMPLLLGLLETRFAVYQIVAGIGILTLCVGIFYILIKFPPPKLQPGFEIAKTAGLFKSSWLILVAFFLFFQSGLEAIINNWTTTYLTENAAITERYALYALSLHIVGMIVMRLLIGSVFRSVAPIKIVWVSLLLLFAGTLLLQTGYSFTWLVIGLLLLGAGVAAGFPIMLGLVGERHAAQSGTAFSFVFVVALVGNMLINYITGIIVHTYGVSHLTTISFAGILAMMLLCIFIFKQVNNSKKHIYVSKTMVG